MSNRNMQNQPINSLF